MHPLSENLAIAWINHDAFLLQSRNITLYIDPYQLSGKEPPATYICITHEHVDHCSIEDIRKISTPHTTIITIPDCQSKLSTLSFGKLILVEPNKTYKLPHFTLQTIPAYNTNKFRSPGIVYHPKNDDRIGIIFDIAGKHVYHAGDTDFVEEMKTLTNIDCALVPVSGTYVMTAQEAAEAVNTIKPKLAIPMHYGSIVGTRIDAEHFKTLAKIPVMIVEKETFS